MPDAHEYAVLGVTFLAKDWDIANNADDTLSPLASTLPRYARNWL